MDEQRLRDVVKFGMSPDEIAGQLRAISAAISASAEWIKKNRPRDERNLILFKLLVAPLPYIDLYAQNPSGALSVLAFCTRAAFELDVRLRHVLRSDDNLRKWMAEVADDYVDLLQAIVGIGEPGDPRVQVLRSELDRTESLKLKHKLPTLRRGDTQIATLAREVGLEREYKSLFKIFSKLVHPTAYLVNSENVMGDAQMRDVLLIHLQLYVLDHLKRATDEMGVPAELTTCRPRKDASASSAPDQTQ
jgi:hypothetical protein